MACLTDDSNASKAKKNSEVAKTKFDDDASKRFNIGSKYNNACLSRWLAPDEIKNAISQWLRNPKNMLVMLGIPDSGKTYFCVALANFFIGAKKNVRYMNTRRFFEEIQKNIQANQSQYEAIRKIAAVDILIFDDLAASTNSEWQKEVILDLVDQRYSEEKVTIFTSNLDWPSMRSLLGERTERRLHSEDNLIIILPNGGFKADGK